MCYVHREKAAWTWLKGFIGGFFDAVGPQLRKGYERDSFDRTRKRIGW